MTKSKKIKSPRRKIKNFNEFKVLVKRNGGHIFMALMRYALLICLGFIILMPLLQMVSTTFKSAYELGSPTSEWVPAEISIENPVVAYRLLDYPKSLAYTFFSTLVQVLIQTASAALCGYAFARLKSKALNIMFVGVILTIVVPQSILMLPQYIYFRNFDILGIIKLISGKELSLLGSPITLYILNLTGMGLKSGLYIYIFRQFFRGLPKELEEAAYVDGCGFVKTLLRVVMPNATSGVITVATLSFVWNWNDVYYNNLFVKNTSNLMVRLTNATAYMDQYLRGISRHIPKTFDFLYDNPLYQAAIVSTASLLIILPLLILYLFLQRKFVESASRSGIVG